MITIIFAPILSAVEPQGALSLSLVFLFPISWSPDRGSYGLTVIDTGCAISVANFWLFLRPGILWTKSCQIVDILH